jgi:hypothetical protein
MSEQELNRKMEFIVEQQAQFFADITELKNAQEHTQKHIDHLMSLMTTLIERTLANADAIQANTVAIDALTRDVDALSQEVRALAKIVMTHVQDTDAHKRSS